MEPIRLWRETAPMMAAVWQSTEPTWLAIDGTCEEYAALPRAEYDAREARLDCVDVDGLVYGPHMIRELVKERDAIKDALKTAMEAVGTIDDQRDAAASRAEKAEAQRDAMNAQYESAMEVIHRNAGARRDGLCGILAWIDRAKEAEALLREARVWVHDGVMGRFTPRSCAETVMARIDAHLDGTA